MTKTFIQHLIVFALPVLSQAQPPEILSIEASDSVIGQYDKFELSVLVRADYDNPYDYDQIALQMQLIGPGQQTVTVDGFYTELFELDTTTGNLTKDTSPGLFKIRFAPAHVGDWSYRLQLTDSQGTVYSDWRSFSCIESDHKGLVRTGLTNYLQFDNGSPYIPVGLNMAWPNNNPLLDYQDWLTALSDQGGNFIRLWHAHWGLGIEWKNGWSGYQGLRRYEERKMAYQDWLFDYCASRGIYVMLCLQHHGQVSTQVNPNWSDNPYNAVNGGPCVQTRDFFTDERARAHTRNRLRYIVARWGYSWSILAWELFNEVGWTDNYAQNREAVANWHLEMAAYLKSIDPYQHLITTSFSDETQDPLVWSSPDIDLTQTHYYLNTSKLQRALVNGLQSYLVEFGKPSLTGEFGLGGSSNLANADPDGIHLHNAIWATLFGGGLGTAMSWWWDTYIHPRDLYYHFAPLSALAAEIPFLERDLRPVPASISGVSGDLILTPTLNWGGIGQDTVVIAADGTLEPSAPNLGIYLYGSSFNTAFRSPPTFVVDFPEAGTFTVATNTETGFNPRISITVDGVQLVSQSANVSKTYTVPIPPGRHTITVDNPGRDWITIASYTFSGLGSRVDAYVLASSDSDELAGWVLNRDYNHQWVAQNGEPEPAVGGKLEVDNFLDGVYTVSWFDCLSGALNTSETVFCENGRLQIPLPLLYWDLAFRVERSPVAVRPLVRQLEVSLYPNPLPAGMPLRVQLPHSASGEPLQLSFFDASGRLLRSQAYQPVGEPLEVIWSRDLPAGMYWVEVRQGNRSGSRPVVISR